MSEPTPSPGGSPRSILLAVDSAAPLALVLEAAALFASEWRASLSGVFVEDAELLRAARLPCAFELDMSTAVVRPLEAVALAQVLRQRAEAMRAAMARQAASSRLEWTFRVSQGEIVQETLASAGAELFIVSRAGRSLSSAPSRIQPRRAGASRAPILTVFDGSGESQRALRVGARLSALYGARLVVTLLPTEDTPASTLDEQCRQSLAEQGFDVNLVIDDRELLDAAHLLQTARRWNSGWLVIGRHLPLLDEIQLRTLVEGLGHPVVLVSAPPTDTPSGA